jgi:radical SAM superfamily enzyme YgiQ (UPF0313 family)
MNKLLLINPVGQISGSLLSRFSTFQPLGLAYVAALTPAHWEVKIVDENFGQLPIEDADLVGITAFTGNINRAYELARQYRQKGAKVVLGGIHASMVPEEAEHYADALVVGEAESVWPKVIQDFENGKLGGVYRGARVDLGQSEVRPRRDLLDPRYLFQSVQTSRGCPFNCDFCSVSRYLGSEYRQRRPADVLSELEGIPNQYLFFLDDNLVGHTAESRARAKELFQGMIEGKMRKRWWMQTSINTADDDELLSLAGRSGCMFALIGFESIDEASLKRMKKGINVRIGVENYRRVIRAFHRHGIGVIGSFIIGNDHESPDYYRQLARFLVAAGVDIVQMFILTPLPGTALFERMNAEDRLLHKDFPADWAKYRLSYAVRKPIGIETDTIYRGDNYIKRYIYSFPRYQYRMLKSFFGLRNLVSFVAVRRFNRAVKRGWLGSHYYREYPSTFEPQARAE